jgi:hypothetical protein
VFLAFGRGLRAMPNPKSREIQHQSVLPVGQRTVEAAIGCRDRSPADKLMLFW